MRILLKFFFLVVIAQLINAQSFGQNNLATKTDSVLSEKLYRPAIHFTPAKGWMNDPNGMFYKDGLYHLYFQHYPDATVWGPMHWGHATSADLKYWREEPIAIYPDSIGLIFSGSIVVDVNNTSGFGEHGKAPVVAIFTQHNMQGEKSGKIDFQNQSIAYSNDNGFTWKKYEGNPVLKNPGIVDFRDPKVMWHEGTKKWIMTLATKTKVTFYSSTNLKEWTKESDFGMEIGSHDGVWECPDLFPLTLEGATYWVLTSSINPGGPNKGSATQYFIGNFDGHGFTSYSTKTKWMDYGADNYAGVTFANTGEHKISIGWMSNWIYAQQVPTLKWRSAMTVPRELFLNKVDTELYLISRPYYAVYGDTNKEKSFINDKGEMDSTLIGKPYSIIFNQKGLGSFTISLSNKLGEHLDFGFDSTHQQYFIDRTFAGQHNFNNQFAAKHTAPKLSSFPSTGCYAIIDKTSIELFAENGLTVMTDIFFPSTPFTKITTKSNTKASTKKWLKVASYLTP